MHFYLCSAHILLYDTEDSVLEQFDCIHYTAYEERVSYCRRVRTGTFTIGWEYTSCLNDGTMWTFKELLDGKKKPSDVLSWSSSVERADNYASLYYNRSWKCSECWLCQCKPGTFGTFCQYQLTHEAHSFEESINAQFQQKESDRWGIQQHGNILCYVTLKCNHGQLCLDWRDICDGYQQCIHGLDEENCDLLEFNECEVDEYRCDNGMCIAEEFWLDGVLNPFNITGDNRYPSKDLSYRNISYIFRIILVETDCMDWTDETWGPSGYWCPTNPRNIECDEHVTPLHAWSCGDGQFIERGERMAFQQIIPPEDTCYNLRNLYYLCESARPNPLWTFRNGMCNNQVGYDDLSRDMNMQLDNTTRCAYVIRCGLSNGFERDCPCNYKNCSSILTTVCNRELTYTLSASIIRPYIQGYYHWVDKQDWTNPAMDEFRLDGAVKCRGYEASTITQFSIVSHAIDKAESILCFDEDPLIKRNYTSRHKFHESCWSNESLTFNNRRYAFVDICTSGRRECISQYRIQNKISDCTDSQDEQASLTLGNLCWNLRKHRFRCSSQQPSCISVQHFHSGCALCKNLFDENLYGTGVKLSTIACLFREDPNCSLLKKYISNSWMNISKENDPVAVHPSKPTTRLQHHYYCDTIWQLPDRSDESSIFCKDWICLPHQYQCRTGQCISLVWVCDGEWDCSDASDEEAIILNQPWSSHNERLNSTLAERVKNCVMRYSKQLFSNLCNAFEYPCYPANITKLSDVLNGTQRPCIDLNQIGDGVSDCYMSLDERNLVSIRDNNEMLGFNFRCSGNFYVRYSWACLDQYSCFDPILCSYKSWDKTFCSGRTDVVCFNKTCAIHARCDGVHDCLPYGEDEYWCAPETARYSLQPYRQTKMQVPAQ
ncbi:unnamed protein product [Adineta ricciae]|uniref:Uncharacterized protein n=1 Tax=Adineta ricciae TaxID=249248 RepID=A0A815P527_ADIRI|nr:unnamed protein product [Adineta ricciae]